MGMSKERRPCEARPSRTIDNLLAERERATETVEVVLQTSMSKPGDFVYRLLNVKTVNYDWNETRYCVYFKRLG
jgi:hypothetical protein